MRPQRRGAAPRQGLGATAGGRQRVCCPLRAQEDGDRLSRPSRVADARAAARGARGGRNGARHELPLEVPGRLAHRLLCRPAGAALTALPSLPLPLCCPCSSSSPPFPALLHCLCYSRSTTTSPSFRRVPSRTPSSSTAPRSPTPAGSTGESCCNSGGTMARAASTQATGRICLGSPTRRSAPWSRPGCCAAWMPLRPAAACR